MDNVRVAVDDLAAMNAFFLELGFEVEGEMVVEAPAVDRLIDDLDEPVARLLAHGTELVGAGVCYGESHQLASLRGPEGIIVG